MSTLDDFFQKTIPDNIHKYEEHSSKLKAKVFFEIVGEDGWLLELDQGKLSVNKVKACEGEDCRVVAKKEVFEDILSGKKKILSSLMFGKIKLKGNLALAKQIAGIIQGKS